jgi:hypothetical protein
MHVQDLFLSILFLLFRFSTGRRGTASYARHGSCVRTRLIRNADHVHSIGRRSVILAELLNFLKEEADSNRIVGWFDVLTKRGCCLHDHA